MIRRIVGSDSSHPSTSATRSWRLGRTSLIATPRSQAPTSTTAMIVIGSLVDIDTVPGSYSGAPSTNKYLPIGTVHRAMTTGTITASTIHNEWIVTSLARAPYERRTAHAPRNNAAATRKT